MITISIFYCCKQVYSYEYMDDYEKCNKTSSPKKGNFYSHLNIEDITDAYYMHAENICKDFQIKCRRIP